MTKGLTLLVFLCSGGVALAQETAVQLTFESCRACHGSDTGGGAIPTLQGLSYEDLLERMKSFAEAEGSATIMHRFAVGLSAAEIESLARYVSSRKDPSQ